MNRLSRNVLPLAAAALACIAAWVALFYFAFTNPSPWRALGEVIDGQPEAGAFVCSYTAFAVGDTLYRGCNTSSDARTMRIRMNEGVAESVGPARAMDLFSPYLTGFAPNESGDILALVETGRLPGWNIPTDIQRTWGASASYYDPDSYEIWHADTGEAESLGLPLDVFDGGTYDTFRGAAWVNGAPEVMVETRLPVNVEEMRAADPDAEPLAPSEEMLPPFVTLYRYTPGAGWDAGQQAQVPTQCQTECLLQQAWFEDGVWRLLYLRMDQGSATQDILVSDLDGNAEPANIPVGNMPDAPEVNGSGVRAASLNFSPALANVSEIRFESPQYSIPYRYADGVWTPLTLPGNIWEPFEAMQGNTPDYFSKPDDPTFEMIYRAAADPGFVMYGLANSGDEADRTYVPKINNFFEIDGRWLELEQAADGYLYLRDYGQPNPPALLKNAALGDNGRNWRDQLVIVPSEAPGYWILSGRGGVLHVDENLRRTDPMTIFERVPRLFDNFRLLGWNAGDEWYYPDWTPFKQLAVPFVLLFFPLCLLLAFVRRQREWLKWEPLPILAVVYIVVAVAASPWYVQLLNIF